MLARKCAGVALVLTAAALGFLIYRTWSYMPRRYVLHTYGPVILGAMVLLWINLSVLFFHVANHFGLRQTGKKLSYADPGRGAKGPFADELRDRLERQNGARF